MCVGNYIQSKSTYPFGSACCDVVPILILSYLLIFRLLCVFYVLYGIDTYCHL